MIYVIAGIIKRKDEKYLITPRKEPLILDELYEFPGGKMEKYDKNEEACLQRELWEEGGIEVIVGDFFHENIHTYPFGTIKLRAYLAELISGEFKSKVHYDPKWVYPREMGSYIFCPADRPIVRKFMSLYSF